MDLSVVMSRALSGLDAPLVRVETHLSNGLPAFNIVGLPETAVRESKDRVRCALLNSHFSFPDRRITVNLAPADLPKEGGRFDLPIALGILVASGQLPADLIHHHEFLGELALDGSLRAVTGSMAAARSTTLDARYLVVAAQSAESAARVPNSTVIAACDLLTLCAHLNGSQPIEPTPAPPLAGEASYPDLNQVAGQLAARRALEIAAAGAHHLLLFGPPGTGKTMLASRLPGILPAPDAEESLCALIMRDSCENRVADKTETIIGRPFRNPHHTASAIALVGGGSKPRPGEVSLAHGGVLFLDELPEFSRQALEVLREPLESGWITISRARHKVSYPARFQLIAAMNPCPCGYLGDPERACRCTPEQIQRYRARVSGPLLDRIDMQVPVTRLPAAQLLAQTQNAESSYAVRQRVLQARACQQERQGSSNALLAPDTLAQHCALAAADKAMLEQAADRLQLSGRALHRTLRVARTIADMDDAPAVSISHLSEALAYRAPSTTL
tara:strand:+ start:102584 stop:104092 length:1509 start_codon:yes stop_codon:yes gene_type:complete